MTSVSLCLPLSLLILFLFPLLSLSPSPPLSSHTCISLLPLITKLNSPLLTPSLSSKDESLMSFIKGGLRIRQCYSMYKWVTTPTKPHPQLLLKNLPKKLAIIVIIIIILFYFLFFKNFIFINTDHISFRSFHQWVESNVAEGVALDPEFIAGVQLGIGCFNLVIYYYFFNPKFWFMILVLGIILEL